MREIKFRAYHELVGMLYDVMPGDCLRWANEGQPLSVEQYLGLKDNTKWEQLTEIEQSKWLDSKKTKEQWNGKDIYEGDIVKEMNYSPLDGSDIINPAWLIYFDIGGFRGKCANGFFDIEVDASDIAWREDCEVIGNIHENPELLEEK